MARSIPASYTVSVTPGVLSAGGTALDLIGLMLTNNIRVPTGTVPSFPTLGSVQAYFGASSDEAALAAVYFGGFTNSNKKPGALLFAQYPSVSVSAYLRGAKAGLTLTQLQALPTGTLNIPVDGTTHTGTGIDLSAATSFSAAAALIQSALDTPEPTEASFTGSIAGTTLTVTAVASGTLSIGQVLTGTGVTAGTQITALGSGAGETGTYTVGTSQTVASETLTATDAALNISYDSVSGAFVVTSGVTGEASNIGFASGTLAGPLGLTQGAGAVTSQGAAAATPIAFMAGLVNVTTNWASFMTVFEPSQADKISFAEWVNEEEDGYVYACWESDASPAATNLAAGSTGYLIGPNSLDYSGTCLVWNTPAIAAFVCGTGASIDFTELNGRITFKFKGQTGLAPTVTDALTAANLKANGYNYYGSNATANDNFNFFAEGSISGPFLWLDSYFNDIWLSNGLQLAMVVLATQAKSIPYTPPGYALIEAAGTDPIIQGVNFGAIRSGVVLSEAQIAEVNAAAGLPIDGVISTRGWFFQVLDPGAQVRGVRGTPACTLWYTDGGSVHNIALASIDVQ